jgi:hypothetical protein
MSHTDKLALAVSLLAIFFTALVAHNIYENVPHLEDEIAYVWQARLLTEGKLSIPSPPHEKSFLVPFVVDYNGQRFGKYPPGWPLVLSLGVALGVRELVNPILAGLGVWLTYLLGKHVFGPRVGLLAAALTITSPFFYLNSASLLSHQLGLVLSAGFALLWLVGFADPLAPRRWPYSLGAALVIGFLILARPFTALGVALPFALHGLYLFFFSRPSHAQRRQIRLHLLSYGVLVLVFASLHFVWQYRVTGDPLMNPYTLWWEYDKIGFGPGVGVTEEGHNLHIARINTRHSLQAGWSDLFGWASYSWLFLPFGLLASLRKVKGLLIGAVFPSLVFLHIFYWIGSQLYGPRYYYEGLYSLTILTALGIAWLAGWRIKSNPAQSTNPAPPGDSMPTRAGTGLLDRLRHGIAYAPAWFAERSARVVRHPALCLARRYLVPLVVILLVSYNLAFFLPGRLGEMHNLYTISRADLEPFLTPEAQQLTPALIIVHSERWMSYGALLELEDPRLTSPFIFAWSRGPTADQEVAADFPERNLFHYYVDEPGLFYLAPKNP